MKVVTYTCSDCGAKTDSTQSMLGWAFGSKGQRWCPDCEKAKRSSSSQSTAHTESVE